jgi:Leucine-rich repeat (LRR) protein
MHLVLAWCGLKSKDLIDMKNPNLRFLDLSHNLVEALHTNVLFGLINLRTLILSHNPLTSVHSVNASLQQLAFSHVDLSHTGLSKFSGVHWEMFPSIRVLNLSYVATLHEITNDGLKYLPLLEELDISHSPVLSFPTDVFSGLSRLRKLSTENYKMCCTTILPRHLDQQFCNAPEDEISSCDDLLRSGVYMVFSWLICTLSFIGNVFSLAFRSCVQKNATKSAFNMFVSGFSLADLFMGVYVAIIVTADAVSRGQYLVFEREWVSSVA